MDVTLEQPFGTVPPMPLDPEVAPIVELLNAAAAEAPPIDEQTPEMRRAGYLALVAMIPKGPELAEVSDRTIPGPAGDIPVRVYRPDAPGPLGVLVYYHGGGWCIGDLETHDEVCRTLADRAGVVVVAVDYRLGPEHRFPAAVEDAIAAGEWVAANAAELGGDPQRLAVGGDSAGGNLATVVALHARDAGTIPGLRFQLLVYPSVDMRFSGYPSMTENAEGYLLTRQGMDWFREHYLSDPSDVEDWRASPITDQRHDGLPPALILTAEFDPLRDEGAAYAETLRSAGVEVTHTNYDGMVHIFFQLGPLVSGGRRAVDEAAAALAVAIGSAGLR